MKLLTAILFAGVAAALAGAAEPEKAILIEARIIKLRDQSFQTLKLNETLKKDGTQCLDADARAALLTAMKCCADLETVTAPRMMVENKQTGTFQIGGQHVFIAGYTVEDDGRGTARFVPREESRPVGLQCQFTPRIIKDGIELCCDVSRTTVSPKPVLIPVTAMITPVFEGGSQGQSVPFTQFIERPCFDTVNVKQTVALPTGQSVLVKLGSRTCETRTEFGPPVISQIPYLNRLFKNVGIAEDTEHSVILLAASVAPAAMQVPPMQGGLPQHGVVRVALGGDLSVVMPPLGPAPVPPSLFMTQMIERHSCCPPPERNPFEASLPQMPLHPCPPVAATLPPAMNAEVLRAMPTPVPCAQPQIIRCDGKGAVKIADGNMMLTADRVEIRTAAPAKNAAILTILLEQYDAACKAGDAEKSKTIAAFCLEMDPTCFAGRK